VIKQGFKKLKSGNQYYKYQRFQCKTCQHFFVLKDSSSRYENITLQAKITFEYLLNRSLRTVSTSKAAGKVSKDKILFILLSVSKQLPRIQLLNKRLNIQWSGKFALDALFFRWQGKCMALLLCSDFKSLDVVGYAIAERENYDSWNLFLINLRTELTKGYLTKFFVTDGKRGLHQALNELFPKIPTQLCTTHKQRRINQIVPHVYGDGYDKLFAHLAHRAIKAPLKEMFEVYLGVLLDLQKSEEHQCYTKPRQEKLKRIIGTLRFQKSKLHTRYQYPDLIDDTTTNHLEGINSFLKERLNLIKGFKKTDNAILLIKLLIYHYRFHKFTSSKFKHRNGKCPVELNQLNNQCLLEKILKGNQPYSWIRNLLKPT